MSSQRALALVCGVVISVLMVYASSSSEGLGILEHTACVPSATLGEEYVFMPAFLANSPYGGGVWANGSMAANFPGGPGYPTSPGAYGGGALNGTAGTVFFSVNLSLVETKTVLLLGPGADAPCSSSLTVIPSPAAEGRGFAGYQVPTVSNLTDAGEAATVNLSGKFAGNPSVPTWNNSYFQSNSPSISTCGADAENQSVSTQGLPLAFSFNLSHHSETVQAILPFEETFHYHFPADFGTWQVDNLSAPGGPGGGWAFDYTGPCP